MAHHDASMMAEGRSVCQKMDCRAPTHFRGITSMHPSYPRRIGLLSIVWYLVDCIIRYPYGTPPIQRQASKLRHRASPQASEHQACNMQLSCMQHASMRHAACGMWHVACGMHQEDCTSWIMASSRTRGTLWCDRTL